MIDSHFVSLHMFVFYLLCLLRNIFMCQYAQNYMMKIRHFKGMRTEKAFNISFDVNLFRSCSTLYYFYVEIRKDLKSSIALLLLSHVPIPTAGFFNYYYFSRETSSLMTSIFASAPPLIVSHIHYSAILLMWRHFLQSCH